MPAHEDVALIFVRNMPPESTTPAEIRERFERYGRVLEVTLFPRFCFVQFLHAADAVAAMEAERGGMIGGGRVGAFCWPGHVSRAIETETETERMR